MDAIVFCQLLLWLRESCGAEVAKPARSVGLVRLDARQGHWLLLCSTPESITFSVVECGEDPVVSSLFL